MVLPLRAAVRPRGAARSPWTYLAWLLVRIQQAVLHGPDHDVLFRFGPQLFPDAIDGVVDGDWPVPYGLGDLRIGQSLREQRQYFPLPHRQTFPRRVDRHRHGANGGEHPPHRVLGDGVPARGNVADRSQELLFS